MSEAADGRRRILGAEEWAEAARRAGVCRAFTADAEEEQVADEGVSCYNCRYRRWLAAAIVCLAPGT